VYLQYVDNGALSKEVFKEKLIGLEKKYCKFDSFNYLGAVERNNINYVQYEANSELNKISMIFEMCTSSENPGLEISVYTLSISDFGGRNSDEIRFKQSPCNN
jgi:hypothetical protein